MRRFRFSIAGLLILVMYCGVAAAALRASSAGWDSAIFGGTLLMLALAILRAIHARGLTRAYWQGFALFGGIYLGASLIPPMASRLPTTKGLTWLDAKRPATVSATGLTLIDLDEDGVLDLATASGAVRITSGNRGATAANTWATDLAKGIDATTLTWSTPRAGWTFFGPGGSTDHFLRIGHALFALIFAALGAAVSRRMADRPIPPDGAPA